MTSAVETPVYSMPFMRKRLKSSRFPEIAKTLIFRSEEHTSELQSLTNLVCRLLLEKKKDIDCMSHFVPDRVRKLIRYGTEPRRQLSLRVFVQRLPVTMWWLRRVCMCPRAVPLISLS